MAPKETMKLKTSKRSRSSKTARRSHSANDAPDGSDSSKTIVEVSDSSCDSPDKKPKVTVGLGDGYVLEVTVGEGDAPDEECLRRVEEETQHRLADVAPYDPSVPMAVAKAKAVAKARRDGTLAPEDSGLACSSSSFKDEIGVWVDTRPWNRRGPSAIPDIPPPITLTPKAHNHHDMPPPDGFDHDKADDTMRKVYKEHREQMVLAQQGRWHHAESLQRTRVMESLQVYKADGIMRIMDSDGEPCEESLLRLAEEEMHKKMTLAEDDKKMTQANAESADSYSDGMVPSGTIEAKATAQDASCQQEASQSPLEESYVPNDSQNPFPENCDTLEVDWE